MKHKHILKNVAILPLLLGIPLAQAHSPDESDVNALTELTRKASLVIYGEVADIQYRNSVPTEEQPQGVPHTFVTYHVKDVLRGVTPDGELTLRIPGGADSKGGVYMDSSAPTFARGQVDVLFIKGGKIDGCQLVNCVEGRFRIHEDHVYNGWGVPVVLAGKEFKVGGKPRFDLNIMEIPRPDFKSMMENPLVREQLSKDKKLASLDMKTLQARYESEAPPYTSIDFGIQDEPAKGDDSLEPSAHPIDKFDGPLAAQVFLDAVRELNQHLTPPQDSVQMADPKQRFAIPESRTANLPLKDTNAPKVTEEERLDKRQRPFQYVLTIAIPKDYADLLLSTGEHHEPSVPYSPGVASPHYRMAIQ